MKKLLIILGTVGLLTPSVGTLVSCANPFLIKNPDIWKGDKWQSEFSDLTFENLSHESETKEKYRLVSKSLDLDFIVEKNQINNKTYGVIDKIIRLDELDLDKYNHYSTIDTCIIVATSERNLPWNSEYIGNFPGKYVFGDPIIEKISVKNINAGQEGEVDERPFIFKIFQNEVYKYWEKLFESMARENKINGREIVLDETKKIEDTKEIFWNDIVVKAVESLDQSREFKTKLLKHFEKYVEINLDLYNNFEPFWEWDPVYQNFQTMNNLLTFKQKKMNFEYRFEVKVKTSKKL